MENAETLASYERTIDLYERLFRITRTRRLRLDPSTSPRSTRSLSTCLPLACLVGAVARCRRNLVDERRRLAVSS